MGVSLELYRASIGKFNSVRILKSLFYTETVSLFGAMFSSLLSLLYVLRRADFIKFQYFFTLFHFSLILLSGDIEPNPGPRDGRTTLSVCHWNLNSVWVDDFSKITQISAFLSVHSFDIFCLGETFLTSQIQDDDPRLEIEGYEILRCDHPSDTKRGGVSIYYRDHLSLVGRPELTSLSECVVCEVKSGVNKCFLCLCYRSPSQNSEQFDTFKLKWEETVININQCSPTLSIYIGDFNARNSDWWTGDTTDTEGRDLGDLAEQYSLFQVIDKPTHILPNSSTCIDLIFTSVKNLTLESGVLPSLYPRCHHQVTFAKVNFKISFPQAYKRKIWDFSRADSRLIRRAMDEFDWDRAFTGVDLNRQVSLLTETITNIFSNFVPNKTITVRNKDALWMTDGVKRLILEKAKIYRRFVKRGRKVEDLQSLREITFRCKVAVKDAKDAYFSRLSNSLNDPNIDSKRYWSILNQFLHRRKIPKIPPVRDSNNVLISDVKTKADVFNSFFATQCSLIDTNSVLPPESFVTDLRLDSVVLDEAKVLALIRGLNVNKAHGWDDISIRMIKICDESLVYPLMKIFNFSLASHKFPDSWKKGNSPFLKLVLPVIQ